MILTCPSCTMRYLVAEGAIGPEGRNVRCANCGNQWFQEGEIGLDEELFGSNEAEDTPFEDIQVDFEDHENGLSAEDGDEEASDDFQAILQKEIEAEENAEPLDIPEGVRPVHHEELIIPVKVQKKVKLPPMDKLGGFGTAALVWLMIVGVLVLCQPQISRAWPPSNMLYTLMGMKPSVPGEGLALDNLQAKFTDGKIVMTGDINNLKSADIKMPAIMAMIVDKDGEILDRVLIPPTKKIIAKESTLSFDVMYPSLPKGATSVNYAFSFLKVPVADKPEKPAEEKTEKSSASDHDAPAEHTEEGPAHKAPESAPHH